MGSMVDVMKQVLVCKKCDQQITDPVQIFDIEDPNLPTDVITTDYESVTKRGFVIKSEQSIMAIRLPVFEKKVRAKFGDDPTKTRTFQLKQILHQRFKKWDEDVYNYAWYELLHNAINGRPTDDYPLAYKLHFAPQYWIEPDDIVDSLSLINEEREYELEDGFCCAPSGFFGPNTWCHCGETIGTSCLDCNAPQLFIPDMEKTKWQNVKS